MYKLIFALYLLLFPIVQFAQPVEVDWGKKFRVRGLRILYQELIGHNNDFYYVLNKQRKRKEIFQYDFNHQLIKVTSLQSKFQGQKISVNQIINTRSNSFLLSSSKSKKKKLVNIYYSKVQEHGEVEKKIRHLFSYDYERNEFLQSEQRRKPDITGISISQDSSKVLFAYVDKFREEKDNPVNENYQLAVFDDQMNKLWEKRVEFPFIDRSLLIEHFEINNSGEVFFLAKRLIKKNKYKKAKHDYYFFKITKNGEIQSKKVELESKYPTRAFLKYLENGNIFVGGFYIKGGRKDKQHGVFGIKYDNALDVVEQNSHLLEKDYLDQLRKKYGIDVSKSVFYDMFQINNVIIDYNSNSIIFFAEIRYHKLGRRGSGSVDVFHSNSIFISSLAFDGSVKWITGVRKNYEAENNNRKAVSYVLGYQNSNIYLLYNDYKTSKETKDMPLKRTEWSSAFTEMVKINDKGEQEMKEILFTSLDIGRLIFQPRLSRFVHGNKFLLQSKTYQKCLFGTVVLP